MNTKRNIITTTIIIIACIATFWLSTSDAVERSVEVQPRYSLPENRTDTARAIDAYQQMINRMLDNQERSAAATQAQLQEIIIRMDRIEKLLAKCANACGNRPDCKKTYEIESPVEGAKRPNKETANSQ